MTQVHPSNRKTRFTLWLSLGIASFLFAILLITGSVCLDSEDDIYFLYRLAGEYGNDPTYFLHYNYGMHFLFAWPIAKLFSIVHMFNWYTSSLVLIQFISFAFLCFNILGLRLRSIMSMTIILLLFLLMEAPCLINLDFSRTALIAAISGQMGLLILYGRSRLYFKYRTRKAVQFLSFMLIVIASLLRLHTTVWIGIMMVWLFMVLSPRLEWGKFMMKQAAIWLTISTLTWIQYLAYQKYSPDWKREERFRNALFSYYNHPHIQNGLRGYKQELLGNSFIYDTAWVNENTLEVFASSQRDIHLNKKHFLSKSYWLFINERAGWLAVFTILALLIVQSGWSVAKKWMIAISVPLIIFLILMSFFKITQGMTTTMLGFSFLSVLLLYEETPENTNNRNRTFVAILLMLPSMLWLTIRLYSNISYNQIEMVRTDSILAELQKNSSTLFINASTDFPIKKYPIGYTPEKHPLGNLLHQPLIFTHTYPVILDRMGIKNLMEEMPKNENILLIGTRIHALKDYYEDVHHLKVDIIDSVPGFPVLKPYRVKVAAKPRSGEYIFKE
jgi:hypothetical protein